MQISKRILIVCEGFTEQLYAKSLKEELSREAKRSINIEIANTQKSNSKNLVDYAIAQIKKARRERNQYQKVFIFFDHDNCPNLAESFRKIKENNIDVAFCSICIESSGSKQCNPNFNSYYRWPTNFQEVRDDILFCGR